MKDKRNKFRDRPLKKGERYHHYCSECGIELHSDMAYSHKCNMKRIPMASFTFPKDRKRFIDKKEVTRPDGKIDYLLLWNKVNELGIRLQKESRILERL